MEEGHEWHLRQLAWSSCLVSPRQYGKVAYYVHVVQVGVSVWQAHCKEPSMPKTSGGEGNDLWQTAP